MKILEAEAEEKICIVEKAKEKLAKRQMVQTPPKQPQPCEPFPQAKVCRKQEHCDSCNNCKWHGSKGEDHEVGSDNGNTGKSEEYLGLSMQPNDEQLKNKIELLEELVICEHGDTWTSVFQHGDQWPTQKEWTWVKYVMPMSSWDDLNEYKESIKVSLGLESKSCMDNEQAQADCLFIPQLDPELPAIQEEYAKKCNDSIQYIAMKWLR